MVFTKIKRVLMGALILAAAGAALGCGQNEGEGILGVEVWGEDFITEGIPADAFADGWEVAFDKFLINLKGIAVGQEGEDPALEAPTAEIWDLSKTSNPATITKGTVPAGAYPHTAYSIGAATTDSQAGNARSADAELMAQNGYSVYAEGSASNGTDRVSFAWGFDTTTQYDRCHSQAVIEDGGSATVQITIHGDHLFYDDAVKEDPDLRFQDIANADADGDGTVTASELEAYDITPLADYGVGNLSIDNLWDFIAHMTTTLGHIDGEGHCES